MKIILIVLPSLFYCTTLLFAGNLPESIKDIETSAIKGDAEAQYRMGRHCLKGNGGVLEKQDFDKAAKWFRLAAEQGHAESLFGLGWILSRKAETEDDEYEIALLFEKAAKKGNSAAQYSLAMYILNGKANLDKNLEYAAELLKKAAAQKNPKAHTALVEMAHKKECSAETGEKSFRWLINQADKGDITAQYDLGRIYEYGFNVPQNYENAMTWYRKAALQSSSSANIKLGKFYESGLGVSKDYQKAKQFYETAVKLGDFNANWNIAQLYEKGHGVPKDEEKAVQYYFKAAQYGHPKSMSCYGIMLAEGRGIAQNDAVAAKWLSQAASWGDVDAQFYLGKMYQKGRIEVEIDDKEKLKWWVKLVRGRHHNAKLNTEHRLSIKWYEKAAAQGHEGAKMELERDSKIGGWLQLFAGLLIIPFSIAGFIWPHVLARGRNQFMARFVGAPISLLIGIVMVIEALKKFELL